MSFARVSVLSLSRIDVQSFRVLLLRRSRRFLLLSCITCQCDPMLFGRLYATQVRTGMFCPVQDDRSRLTALAYEDKDRCSEEYRTFSSQLIKNRVRHEGLITCAAASSCLVTTLECDPPVQHDSVSYFCFWNSVLTGLGSDGSTSSTHNGVEINVNVNFE